MFRRRLRGRCTVIRLGSSVIRWSACQLETSPSTFPFGTEWRPDPLQKAYCKLYENACFPWWLTLFNIERVSRPKFYPPSRSSYLVDPSSSSSCQFFVLGNKGAVDPPCVVIFWALFSLRRQWRRWQLLRRVDRRSADKCIVFVIGFFFVWLLSCLYHLSEICSVWTFGTPACISIFIAISLFTTLTEKHVLTPGNSSLMMIIYGVYVQDPEIFTNPKLAILSESFVPIFTRIPNNRIVKNHLVFFSYSVHSLLLLASPISQFSD